MIAINKNLIGLGLMHFFCRVITQVLPAWLASHRIADLLQQMLPKFSIHFIHMMQISNHLTIYPTFPPPFKGFIKSNCSQSIRRENSSIWQDLFICPNLAGGAQGTHFSALQKHYMYVFQKYFPISNFKENSFHIRRKFLIDETSGAHLLYRQEQNTT